VPGTEYNVTVVRNRQDDLLFSYCSNQSLAPLFLIRIVNIKVTAEADFNTEWLKPHAGIPARGKDRGPVSTGAN